MTTFNIGSNESSMATPGYSGKNVAARESALVTFFKQFSSSLAGDDKIAAAAKLKAEQDENERIFKAAEEASRAADELFKSKDKTPKQKEYELSQSVNRIVREYGVNPKNWDVVRQSITGAADALKEAHYITNKDGSVSFYNNATHSVGYLPQAASTEEDLITQAVNDYSKTYGAAHMLELRTRFNLTDNPDWMQDPRILGELKRFGSENFKSIELNRAAQELSYNAARFNLDQSEVAKQRGEFSTKRRAILSNILSAKAENLVGKTRAEIEQSLRGVVTNHINMPQVSKEMEANGIDKSKFVAESEALIKLIADGTASFDETVDRFKLSADQKRLLTTIRVEEWKEGLPLEALIPLEEGTALNAALMAAFQARTIATMYPAGSTMPTLYSAASNRMVMDKLMSDAQEQKNASTSADYIRIRNNALLEASRVATELLKKPEDINFGYTSPVAVRRNLLWAKENAEKYGDKENVARLDFYINQFSKFDTSAIEYKVEPTKEVK